MVESVSSRLCVLWSVEDPCGLDPAWAVFEDGGLSQWVCWCGTELVVSRSLLFLSIQGHCWGPPEDQACTEACQQSGRPHGPSKTCGASSQGMYKLTRWVYLVNMTSMWYLGALTFFADWNACSIRSHSQTMNSTCSQRLQFVLCGKILRKPLFGYYF